MIFTYFTLLRFISRENLNISNTMVPKAYNFRFIKIFFLNTFYKNYSWYTAIRYHMYIAKFPAPNQKCYFTCFSLISISFSIFSTFYLFIYFVRFPKGFCAPVFLALTWLFSQFMATSGIALNFHQVLYLRLLPLGSKPQMPNELTVVSGFFFLSRKYGTGTCDARFTKGFFFFPS